MKKKVIIGLIVLVMALCVCLVACDPKPSDNTPDDQTKTKDIRDLVNEDEKFTFSFDGIITSVYSGEAHFHFILDVDYTKLNNYQALLKMLGLSETYESEEERIAAGYYFKFNDYYSDCMKGYFPNGQPYWDVSLDRYEQHTIYMYTTFEMANEDYDSILRLAERKEIVGIHILARIGFYDD